MCSIRAANRKARARDRELLNHVKQNWMNPDEPEFRRGIVRIMDESASPDSDEIEAEIKKLR